MKQKINNKGFTLIELLAVIVIMGILMLVAIPAMSRYMENSRRDTFKSTAQQYTNAVKDLWVSDGLACNVGGANIYSSAVDTGTYYVAINSDMGLMESGGKSSWSNKKVEGYVQIKVNVSTTKRTNTYSVSLVDGTHGIQNFIEADTLVRTNVALSGATNAATPSGYECTIVE